MRVAATYLSEIAEVIDREKDIHKAQFKYAMFFQGSGHPLYGSKELERLIHENLPQKLKARAEYELGIIYLESLHNYW